MNLYGSCGFHAGNRLTRRRRGILKAWLRRPIARWKGSANDRPPTLWARCWPGYSLSGCFPPETDSASGGVRKGKRPAVARQTFGRRSHAFENPRLSRREALFRRPWAQLPTRKPDEPLLLSHTLTNASTITSTHTTTQPLTHIGGNLAACHRCPRRQSACAGACLCTVDERDIIDHARVGDCPLGRHEAPLPSSPRGLGDVVAGWTHRLGVDHLATAYHRLTGHDCGCQKRRERLNALVPFGGKGSEIKL